MSKLVGTVVAVLMVLPLLAQPSFAAKNIGGFHGNTAANAESGCSTILIPQWQCPAGDEPGNWPLTKCKLVMVPQTVCHAD